MSNIPSSAMPHAKASEGSESESQQEQGGGGPTITERAGKLREQATDYARENPKTAIAAGAALAAGVIAAAVVPLVRGRSGSDSGSGSGGSKKSGGGTGKTTGAKKS
jgi:hypothetical protein